ncbi:MAG: hypothetical protein ACI8RD_004063, partial [Bacillariaceae sp.]|jgi:hypothetical protein
VNLVRVLGLIHVFSQVSGKKNNKARIWGKQINIFGVLVQ